jgi:AcrR family transcriptional regulator
MSQDRLDTSQSPRARNKDRRGSSVEHKLGSEAKRHDRQEEFLLTALQLFAERNFATVTVKEIAQSLGVNTALIYYYFDSKTALLSAAIEFIVAKSFENIQALEKENCDPANMIAAWLDNHVRNYSEIHRFVKIALDFKSAHEGDDATEATISRFYAEERKMLSRVIQRGVEAGLFNRVDSDRMAQFISTFLDGCMVRSVILNNFKLNTAVEDLKLIVFEQLGLRARGKARNGA